MSEWLRLVNEMKKRSPQDFFTPTQQVAYTTIVERLHFPKQHLNLWGLPGVGKTYIAWGLARTLDAVHVSSPEKLREYDGKDMSLLIIDNAPYYEDELRALLAEADLMSAGSIVFITHKPTLLRMRQVHLELPSADDLRHIARTFSRLGFYEQSAPPPATNLWQLLQCYV